MNTLYLTPHGDVNRHEKRTSGVHKAQWITAYKIFAPFFPLLFIIINLACSEYEITRVRIVSSPKCTFPGRNCIMKEQLSTYGTLKSTGSEKREVKMKKKENQDFTKRRTRLEYYGRRRECRWAREASATRPLSATVDVTGSSDRSPG